MVWYGMVWYGMVWYGMVWYGLVWFGLVWFVQHKYLAGYYSISKLALSLAQLQSQLVLLISFGSSESFKCRA